MRGPAFVDRTVPVERLPQVADAWPGPDADRADVISGEDRTNDDPVGPRAGPQAYPDSLALVDVWSVASPLADSSGLAAICSSRLRSR